jgi:hypothetical protein
MDPCRPLKTNERELSIKLLEPNFPGRVPTEGEHAVCRT